MISITDIENKLVQKEQGKFQIICNEILKSEGYETFDRTGSEIGTEKTILGTPDSVFIKNGSYVFAEFTTYQKAKLPQKIRDDISKCFKLIDTDKLKGKVSKIIFMHNRKQPSLKIIEEIKQNCQKRKIEFIIYGSDYISDIIQKKYPYIAETHLELKDYDTLLQISKDEIKNSLQNEVKNQDIEKISNRISNLYEEASEITNVPSSLIYLNDIEKNKLKKIYTELINLEYIYEGKDTEESKKYYHNILIILQRYNKKEYIKKFKAIEKYGLLNDGDYNFYADNLMMDEQEENALPILEDLYYNKNDESSFINLIRCYFVLNKYADVLNKLASLNVEKYDNLGILATFFVLSKNFIKELKASDILAFNKKFKDMPLYYASTSQLLFKLKNYKYKNQFNKALNCINYEDYTTINLLCDISIEIKENQKMIDYLIKLNSNNELIKLRIVKLLAYKHKLETEELKYLQENIEIIYDKSIDINYLYGVINENRGLLIKAIENYKQSFISTDNKQALNKYIVLSIKQKNKIDLKIIPNENQINDYKIAMLISEAYRFMGDLDQSIKMSYACLYLLDNNFDKEPFKQFWTITMMYGNKIDFKDNLNLKDTVLTLKELNNNKIERYVIDDNTFYKENTQIVDLHIIKSNNLIVISALGKKPKDTISINNNKYEIINIECKYKYLINYSFNIIKGEKGIEIFKSTSNDTEVLEQISKKISDYSENLNKKLDIYESEKKIPLSSLISEEYNFDDYTKLINTLLCSEHLLYAGESINVDLNNGFVIDTTSLIILTLFDKLDILSDELCKKIYTSKSFKNKFDYYFENLISTYSDKESTIGYDENVHNKYHLVLQEIPNSNKLELWKKLNEKINNFNILDTEFEMDKIVNNQTLNILDKVQFDLIKVAQDRNIPFICDDLFIRQLCNIYKVEHTNTNFLINYNVNDFDEYITNLLVLAKNNYIYTVYNDELQKIIMNLLDNFNEKNKDTVNLLIEQLLSNEKSKIIYKPYLTNIMSNCEKLRYVKIFEEIYENKLAVFLYETLKEKLK